MEELPDLVHLTVMQTVDNKDMHLEQCPEIVTTPLEQTSKKNVQERRRVSSLCCRNGSIWGCDGNNRNHVTLH